MNRGDAETRRRILIAAGVAFAHAARGFDVRHLLGAFGWMMPGELKVFEGNDPTAALEWAAG